MPASWYCYPTFQRSLRFSTSILTLLILSLFGPSQVIFKYPWVYLWLKP